jgi:hypothetical protein
MVVSRKKLIQFLVQNSCPGISFKATDLRYKTVIAHVSFEIFSGDCLALSVDTKVSETLCSSIIEFKPEDGSSMLNL